MTTTATPTLDSADCRRLLAEQPGLRIVDVRTGAEFESAHIPGSYNIPLDTLDRHGSELANLGQPLLLVCQSGARASQADTTLTALGTPELMVLDGGIDAWQSAGGDLNLGTSQTWALDRQVRLAAGAISLTGILASIVAPKAKWLAGGVAAGLSFSAISDTCAMGNVLARLPYNQSATSDVATEMAALSTGQRT